MKQIIKVGDKFNRLTAVRFSHRDKHHNLYWLFKCDCGNKKIIRVNSVKGNITKTCGCLAKEVRISNINYLKRKGMRQTRIYQCWYSMKARCLNKNNKSYKNYGGRGITICDEWMKFENFYIDMGNCPENKSLDRIDNNGNYEPNNCRFATRKEQNNNTRKNHLLTYNGKTQTVSQWSEELNINRNTLFNRLNCGWSIEKAFCRA